MAVYRHHPITGLHPFAREAALAAECAHVQKRFEQIRNVLFDKQDSIGKLPWGIFAQRAGLADTTAFVDCVKRRSFDARVVEDSVAARELGVRGTPTIVIGDSVFYGGMSLEELRIKVAGPLKRGRQR